jgi:tRNA threonylcarbamoyladenosine biosynthesis protein TsaB
MKILALESSAKAASAAVCEDGALLAQYFQNSGLTHSRTLLKMAEGLLRNMDLTPSALGLVAVANGPGSFTGVRIGVAAAKGLAWGASLPVCGVSSLLATATLPQRENVVLCPVMDARRNQVYNAKFTYENGALTRLCEDRALSVAELIQEARDSASPFYLLGDGAAMCYDQLAAAGVTAQLAPAALRWQTAFGVAVAAMGAPASDANDLAPNYLRPSQAERERTKTSIHIR